MWNSLDIDVRFKNLESSISDLQRKIKWAGDGVEKSFGVAGKKSAEAFTGPFGQVKGVLLGMLSFQAINGMVRSLIWYWRQIISLWSDLDETTSKFNVVFEGMEQRAKMAFDTIADRSGRSKLEMMAFGATLGNIWVSFGLTTWTALDLSSALVQLWVDLASFNNVSDEQAINALRAWMTWEFESLKTLGIAINETDIKRKAMTLGIAKEWEELSRTQKLAATYALILERTSKANWDAERTASSWANMLKRLQGTIKDVVANNGIALSEMWAWVLQKIDTFIKYYGTSLISFMTTTWKLVINMWNMVGDSLALIMGMFGVKVNENSRIFQKFIIGVLKGIQILYAWVWTLMIIGNLIARVAISTIKTIMRVWVMWWSIVNSSLQTMWQGIAYHFEKVWNAII